jgi:predicted phage terminase large subunit-like protein
MPCIQVWDTAYGQSDGNSYTACITVYFDGAAFYVADVWYGRPTFPELKEALKAKYYQYNPARVFIEAKASGMSLVQQIQFEAMIPVIPIPANEDKATRLHSVSGLVESGRVKLKNNSPWLEEFMYELTGFPAVARNDITDVFSHSLRMLMPNGEPVSQVVVYDSMPLVNLDL